MSEKKVKRILIVKPSSLGDILHVFPALALLRRLYPEAELDYLVHPAFAPILDYSPFPIRRKILFERKKLGNVFTFLPEFIKLSKELRKDQYDLILDFQGLFRSSLCAFLASRGAVVRGFARPRESISAVFYDEKCVIPPEAGHAVERYIQLLNLPGGSPENFVHPPLPENPEVRSRLEQKTSPLPSTLAALIPGARWESKTFPAELFAAVANRVSAERPETVFCVIGGRSDLVLQQKIAENLDPGVKLLPTAGETSLAEMMELLRGCEFAVSNDSGPVHAAAALGVPVFGLFGPTAPEKTGPYGPDHRVYQCSLSCIKCLKRVCPLRGEEHQLCHKLDPQTIADDILNYLKKQEKSL